MTVINTLGDDEKLELAEVSDPVNALSVAGTTEDPDSSLVAEDDVFLPDASKIGDVDDYQQIKDALEWTSVSYFWPDADQADWVVLEGKAFLSADTPTISIIQGETADITVTSGQNLIFFSGSSLKLNQTGGAAEVFFDPKREAQIELDHIEGVTSFSYLTAQQPEKTEVINDDGSRTLQTGKLSLTYNTGETSKVYIQDLITGDASRAEATKTIGSSAPTEIAPPEVIADTSSPSWEQPLPDNLDPPIVYPRVIEEVSEVEELEARELKQIEDDAALFDGDVLIGREPTEIVQQYFDYAPTASWKYSVDEYVTPNDYSFTVDGQKRDIDIVRSEQAYASVQEEISNQFTELFTANSWDDFLATDILEIFYAD